MFNLRLPIFSGFSSSVKELYYEKVQFDHLKGFILTFSPLLLKSCEFFNSAQKVKKKS